MQVHRTHTTPNATLFAPTGGQPDAEKSAQSLAPAPTAPIRGVPLAVAASPTPVAPGVVLKLSSPSGGDAHAGVYSKGQVLGTQKIDLSNMTLENQLALGRNKGVFTKITLSKDGILLAKPDAQHGAQSSEFVSSAVTAMRDFQEGIALLKEQSTDGASKPTGFFSDGLRSLQNVAAKLNVFA